LYTFKSETLLYFNIRTVSFIIDFARFSFYNSTVFYFLLHISIALSSIHSFHMNFIYYAMSYFQIHSPFALPYPNPPKNNRRFTRFIAIIRIKRFKKQKSNNTFLE